MDERESDPIMFHNAAYPITEVQMLARMPVDPPNSKESAACAGLRQIAAGDVPCATLISTR